MKKGKNANRKEVNFKKKLNKKYNKNQKKLRKLILTNVDKVWKKSAHVPYWPVSSSVCTENYVDFVSF